MVKKHMGIDPFFVCCIYSHRISLLICFSVLKATAIQNRPGAAISRLAMTGLRFFDRNTGKFKERLNKFVCYPS